MVLSIYTILCNHHLYLVPKHFYHPGPWTITPHFPRFPVSANLSSALCLCRFSVLDMSCKYNHTTGGLYLAYCSQRLIHAVMCTSTSPLFRAEWFSIVCSNHSSVGGCLGVSTWRLLWIMLLWISKCKSVCGCAFLLLLGVYLGLKFLSYMVTLCLIFWGAACFPKWLHPLTPPPAMYKDFTTSLSTRAIICLLILTILVAMPWHLTVALICSSLMVNDVECLFMYLLAICIPSVDPLSSSHILCPFLKEGYLFLNYL